EHLDAGARCADPDLAVGGGQRLEQARGVRRAGGAGDPQEDVHPWGLSLLAPAVGALEEDGEPVEPSPPERSEARHRRARDDARWASEVLDLPGEASMPESLGGQVRRLEVRRPVAEIRVARRAAGGRED